MERACPSFCPLDVATIKGSQDRQHVAVRHFEEDAQTTGRPAPDPWAARSRSCVSSAAGLGSDVYAVAFDMQPAGVEGSGKSPMPRSTRGAASCQTTAIRGSKRQEHTTITATA
jgi:hypothetical protein